MVSTRLTKGHWCEGVSCSKSQQSKPVRSFLTGSERPLIAKGSAAINQLSYNHLN